MTANTRLIEKMSVSPENEAKINELHSLRYQLHQAIISLLPFASYHSDELVSDIGSFLFKIEEELQRLWGFPVDSNYYMFWNVPGCQCPKMDNYDAYPEGYYVRNLGCQVHWKKFMEEKNATSN